MVPLRPRKHVAPPLRHGQQLRPEVRVGDADEGLGPLADVFSPEVGYPELGHHVVDVPPGW